MRLVRHSNHESIILDGTLLEHVGGEARIFAVPQESSLVAKVYLEPTEERARKLRMMLANPPADAMAATGHTSIAWPTDLLWETGTTERVVGFLMPRAHAMRPIIDFYNPRTRLLQSPLFTYQYLTRTAANLAAAVGAIHARGYVIGDISESNVFVSETALVTLVDTDSFQVPDPQNGVVYRCRVGRPEFTPPELQGEVFADINRSVEHDLFGLGVLIFLLLMEGTHPFAGISEGSDDMSPYEARIAAGHFPHSQGRRVPYRPVPHAPPFGLLHPALQELFLRCFENGHISPQDRPAARAWQQALDQAERSLVRCVANEQHRYWRHLKHCPWCERTRRLGGRDPFPPQGTLNTPPVPQSAAAGQAPLPAAAATGIPSTVLDQSFTTPGRYPVWAWAAGVLAVLSFVPALRLLAGAGAVVCGILGLSRQPGRSGIAPGVSVLALALGILMVVTEVLSVITRTVDPAGDTVGIQLVDEHQTDGGRSAYSAVRIENLRSARVRYDRGERIEGMFDLVNRSEEPFLIPLSSGHPGFHEIGVASKLLERLGSDKDIPGLPSIQRVANGLYRMGGERVLTQLSRNQWPPALAVTRPWTLLYNTTNLPAGTYRFHIEYCRKTYCQVIESTASIDMVVTEVVSVIPSMVDRSRQKGPSEGGLSAYNAVRLENLQGCFGPEMTPCTLRLSGRVPYARGQRVVLRYDVVNRSDKPLHVPPDPHLPQNNSVGEAQAWLERLGPDKDIPGIPFDIARDAKGRYAAGTSIITTPASDHQWPPGVAVERGWPLEINTSNFPPGKYRAYIEYRRRPIDGRTLIESASIDIDLQ